MERCFKIGLDLPAETTAGHIVSVLIKLSGADLDSANTHALVLDFKRKLKLKFRVANTLGEVGLISYPQQPKDLPESRFNQAYATEGPSDYWATHELGSAAIVPLRRTSSHLRSVPTLSFPGVAPNTAQQMMGMFMTGVMRWQQQHAPAPATPTLRLLRPSTQPRLALTNGSPSPESSMLPNNTDGVLPPADVPHPPSDASLVTPTMPLAQTAQPPLFELPTPPTTALHVKTMQAALDDRAATKAAAKKNASNKVTGKATKPTTPPPKKGKSSASKSKKSAPKAKSSKAAEPAPHVTKSAPKKRPAIPGPSDGTVHYLQGKIHRSEVKKAWRVFINSNNRVDKARSHTFTQHITI